LGVKVIATYRYNVVVEVSIDTNKMNAGNRGQKDALRSIEKEAIESSRRINNEIDRNATNAAEKRNAVINDYKRQTAQFKESQLEQQNQMKNAVAQFAAHERQKQSQLSDTYKMLADNKAFDKFTTNSRQTSVEYGKIIDEMLGKQRQITGKDILGDAGTPQRNQQLKQAQEAQIADMLDAQKKRLAIQTEERDREYAISTDRLQHAVASAKAKTAADVRAYEDEQKLNIQRQKDIEKQIKIDDAANKRNAIGKSNQTAPNVDLKDAGNKIKEFDEKVENSRRGLGMWGQAFKGAFIGAVAGLVFSTIIGGITGIISKTVELGVTGVELAAKFETTRNSLILFAGSARLADIQLANLNQAAKETPGLRLEDAEVGFSRLRALNFEAETALNLTKGIAKQKLISGVTDESAVNRVIVNLQQLKAGSPQIQRDIQQMVLSIPSLSIVINKAFGNLVKFKKALAENPDAAIKKFADSMANAEVPATGLTNKIEKLQDQVIRSERAFGAGTLEPLTLAAQDLTAYLEKNMATWVKWGQTVGDIIQGFRDTPFWNPDFSDFEEGDRDFLGFYDRTTRAQRLGKKVREDKQGLVRPTFDQYVKDQTGLSVDEIRAYDSQMDDLFRKNPDPKALMPDQSRLVGLSESYERDTSSFERRVQVAINSKMQESWKETAVIDAQNAENKRQAEERERRKNLERIDAYYSQVKSIRQSAFEIEIAQNQDNVEKVYAITEKNYEGQIKDVEEFYDRKIKLTDGTDSEIYKIEVERNNALRELDIKQTVLRLNFEREQTRKRREDLLAANSLQRREVESFYGELTRQVERGLEVESITTERGYAEIYDLTARQLNVTTELIKEEYRLRLSDTTLTAQQTVNLEKQRDLDLVQVADETKERILQIRKQQYEAEMKQIEDFTRRRSELLQIQVDAFQNFSSVNSPQFAATGNVKMILEAIQQMRNLSGDELSQKLKEQNTLISSQESVVDTLNKSWTENKQIRLAALDEMARQGQQYDVDEKTRLETEQVRRGEQLGLLTKMRQRSNEIKDDIAGLDKGFFALQAGIKGIFDQIEKTGDYTLFDQIIEQNYKAERALQRDVISSELEGLRKQLINAEQAVRSGTIAPSVANDLQTKVDVATQKLKNFDLQTEIGTTQLETRNNLLKQFNALMSGDATAKASLKWQSETERIKEYNSVLQETILLETGYYRDTTLLALNRRKEIAEANQSIWESQQKIAEQMVFSKEKADAKLYEFLASQKGVTEILSDARINLVTSAFDGLDKVAASLAKNFGFAKDMVQQLISGLLKLAANQIFLKLFGQSLNGGNSSMGPGGTPNFNPNAGGFNLRNFLTGGGGGGFGGGGGSNGTQIMTGGGSFPTTSDGQIILDGMPDIQRTATGRNGATLGGGSGGMSGLGMGINVAAMGAMLIGSKIGGIAGSTLQWGGMGAMIGFQFGGPIGAAIGAGIGAIGGLIAGIVGKSSKRKKEEKIHNQAMIDAFAALDKLIEQVNNDQIDGAQALEQADNIRKQYVDNMNQLTDKKTKSHALQDVARLDARIEKLKTAVASQTARRQRMELYAPTFEDGGSLSKFANDNYRNNPLGYQRGGQKLGYFPASDQYAIYNEKGSEYIFDHETTRNVGTDKLDLIRHTKGQALNTMLFRWSDVQKKADGGSLAPVFVNSNTSAAAPVMQAAPQVHIHVDGTAIGQAIAQALAIVIQSNDGSSSQLNSISTGLENQGQNKLVEQLAELVKEKLGL
jgi:hypothetical protein